MQQPGRLGGATNDDVAVLAPAHLRLDRAPDQLVGRAELDDPAVAQDGKAVGELLRLVEVVRRQEDRLPQRPQRADHLPGRAAGGRVEAGRRLVEEEQLGIADQRDAEVEPPPLPARERLHERLALLRQADQLEHVIHAAGARVVAAEHPDRLGHGQVRPHRGRLEHDADALPVRALRALGIVPEHPHVAAVAPAVALEDLDGGRLAGAVRPEQAEHLADGDLEVDPAQRLQVAVALAQVSDLDRELSHRGARSRAPRPARTEAPPRR